MNKKQVPGKIQFRMEAEPPVPAIEVGLFTTISVLESVVTRFPVTSFLRDTFFNRVDFVNSDVVQIDTYRGARGLAPFVLPMEGQVIGRRKPFSRSFIEAPRIAPAREITLREIGRPQRGESPYNYKTPEQRIAQLIADDTREMDDEIARTEEYMCSKLMFTGKIPINYRNKTNVEIDYSFTNTTALATPWTNNTIDPLNDLRVAQTALNANGYSGDIAVYSPEAWNALWNNTKVRDYMKNVAVQFSPISSFRLDETSPTGIAVAPSFTYPVMANIIYSGTYTKHGVVTPYVPAGSVLIGSRNVQNRLVYAEVVQIEQEDGEFHAYSLDRVPKIECNVNKNFYMYTLTSRPVPVPADLLAWTVLTGTV